MDALVRKDVLASRRSVSRCCGIVTHGKYCVQTSGGGDAADVDDSRVQRIQVKVGQAASVVIGGKDAVEEKVGSLP